MEKDPRDVIIRPVITEHSYDAMENNVYTFEVAKDANKVEIRQAIARDTLDAETSSAPQALVFAGPFSYPLGSQTLETPPRK